MPLAVLAVVALADDASIGQGDYSSHHGVAPGVAFPAAGELQGAFMKFLSITIMLVQNYINKERFG